MTFLSYFARMTEPELKPIKKPKQATSPTTNKPKLRRPQKATHDSGIAITKQLAAKKLRNTRTSPQIKATSQVSPQKRKIQGSQSTLNTNCEGSGEPLLKCRRLHFTAEENKENLLHLKPIHNEADSIINSNVCISTSCSQRRSFSPIPSTSTDFVTIEENEKRFNESFNEKNNVCNNIDSPSKPTVKLDHSLIDLDAENTLCKTASDSFFPALKNDDCIIMDEVITPKTDTCISLNSSKNDIEIIEIPCETITIDDCLPSSTPHNKKVKGNCSPIIVDDYESCLNLNPSSKVNDDDIIDIDALIANNESCLEKYRSEDKNLHTVTCVEAISIPEKQQAGSPSIGVSKGTEAINQREMRRPPQLDKIDSVAGIINNFFEQSAQCSESSCDDNATLLTNNDSITNNTTEHRISGNITTNVITPNNSITQTAHNNSSVEEIINDFFSCNNNRPQSVQNQQTAQVINLNDSSIVEINDSISSPSGQNDSSVIEINMDTSTNAISRPKRNEEYEMLPCFPRNYLSQVVERFHIYGSKRVPQEAAQVDLPLRIASSKTATIPVPSTSKTLNLPATSQLSPQKSPRGIGDCPICMENLSGTAIASTLCGHVFCLNCIKRSITTNGKKCPTCRKSLKGIGYHQLFL